MAGRFSNLEFEGSDDAPTAGPSGLSCGMRLATPQSPVRSAAHCLDEAVRHELAGDLEDALRAYSAALGESPHVLAAWVGQLWMLLELQEYPEVELWSKKAFGYFPRNPSLLAVTSLALGRMLRREDAAALNDEAMLGEGDIDTVWICRGAIMMRGNRATVAQCFQHARRVAANPALARLRIASVCVHAGKYQMAMGELRELTGICPGSARAWAMLGIVQSKLGFAKQAVVSLTQAAEMAPHNRTYLRDLQSVNCGFLARLIGFFRRRP